MAASPKYRGLCETCDHDATCTLKRSSRLEVIHCEQFSTQPVVNRQAQVRAVAPSLAAPQNHSIETRGAKNASSADVM